MGCPSTRFFTEFAREIEPRLRYALVAELGYDSGREAAQDALVYAWEHWELLEGVTNRGGYLYQVAKRRAFRGHRAIPALVDRPQSDPEVIEPGLDAALRRLSSRQRAAVLLVEGLGMTHQEAAELLDISRSSVQTHLNGRCGACGTTWGCAVVPDLKHRIVDLVDTAAPPIDVAALAERLAADAARPAELARSARRFGHPAWAFAAGFVGILLAIGGALTAGMWLYEPGAPAAGGPADEPTASAGGVARWWVVLAAIVVVVGVVAIAVWPRRIVRPITREGDAMQTLERTEESTEVRVGKLTRHRRWLIVTLAIVLVAGAVVVVWLIAENRGLNADLDAAVWPAESELTATQREILDLVGPDGVFYEAWNAGDFDTFYGLHSEEAIVVDPGFGSYRIQEPAGRNLLGMWHSQGYDDLAPERIWVFDEDAVVFVDSATSIPGSQVFFFDLDVTGPGVIIDMFATQFAPQR